MTDRHLVNLFKWHIFPLIQVEHKFCFALSVCFYMQNYGHLEQKNQMICIFAVILICLLPSDHVIDKMSVGHTNENEMYILYFILFENY